MEVASSLRSSSISSLSALKNHNNVSSKLHYYTRRCFSVNSRKPAQKTKASVTMNTVSLEDHYVKMKSQLKDDVYCSINLHDDSNNKATLQLYAILEIICDRIEMHYNVAVQRDNWNSLLLTSTNMITLAAATMAGIVAASSGTEAPLFIGLKMPSTLLFSAATWMSLVMSKIQPSQLAEEQRNATRLFRQLQAQVHTTIAVGNATEDEVNNVIEKILALDKAYPLPILGGAMLEKFPSEFEHAVWWPRSKTEPKHSSSSSSSKNGWSEELEMEMREILEVVKRKDMEDYHRLGNLALKMNKAMAVSAPLLTGIAALGSAIFLGSDDDKNTWMAAVPVVAGAMASVVNALEHGGQVGMVVDMYRYCAGFFKLMEETIETTVEEKNYERRENGEMFEMKMGLMLGRNVSQLRKLASKSSRSNNGADVDEFASKIF